MNYNKAFILGNLTRDPELRQTPSGQAVCNFGMATNRVYTDQGGQRQQQTDFHNIVAWGRQAELAHQYLQKGRLAFVEGRIQTRSWQDQQGNKRWSTEIIADRIQFGPRFAQDASRGEDGEKSDGASDLESSARQAEKSVEEAMPIIELPGEDEIDPKNIPF